MTEIARFFVLLRQPDLALRLHHLYYNHEIPIKVKFRYSCPQMAAEFLYIHITL